MARYRLIVPAPVRKALASLPTEIQRRVRARLTALTDNPRLAGVLKLTGADDLYRVRIGDYRAVYAIDDATKTVLVVRIAHRGAVYE